MLADILMAQTSVAYVYLLSQGKNPQRLVNIVYVGFVSLAIFLLISLTIASLHIEQAVAIFWGRITDLNFVYWALLIAVVALVIKVVTDFSDATQQTLKTEPGKIANNVVLLLGIAYLYIYFDQWQLTQFYSLSLIALCPFFFVMLRLTFPFGVATADAQVVLQVAKDFLNYARPLMLLAIVGAVCNYVGRFSVQYHFSLAEFAYFAFAMGIVSMPVTLISSLMSIYIAEITRQYEKGEHLEIAQQFLKASNQIMAVLFFFVIFVFTNVEALVLELVGEAYLPSVNIIRVLLVFSVFNAISLLSGNIFFSTGRVKQFTQISLVVLSVALLTFASSFYFFTMDALLLAALTTIFLVIRTLIFISINATYLKFSVVRYWLRITVIGVVIAIPVVACSYFFNHIALNAVGSVFALLFMNMMFNDFVGLQHLMSKSTKIER